MRRQLLLMGAAVLAGCGAVREPVEPVILGDDPDPLDAGAVAEARQALDSEPSRYIITAAALDAGARLVLEVNNRAPLAVRDVALAVQIREAGGWATRRAQLTLEGPIGPGQAVQVPTQLGPYDDPRVLRYTSVRVESAEPAD